MRDLFDQSLLAGLDYHEDFISGDEERQIIARLDMLDLAPFRFQGWLGHRQTASFGWRYDFDDSSFTPAEPMPDWLHPLRARAAQIAAAAPDDIHHVLVARYDPGAGIGWHKDRDVFEKVVGVSLGTSAILRFRQRTGGGFRRFGLTVDPGSAYLLSGEARWEWEHRITPGQALRYSITFRTLSDKGRKVAAAQRVS